MIITTTYTQRLTVTTDDSGTVTTRRAYSADTHTAYLFEELSPEAQAHAIEEAIEDEERTYCSGYSWTSQTGISEADIWEAARDLEKGQPIDLSHDAGGSPYGTARGTWWSHPADWERVTEQRHTGVCYSMDLCDTWNAYAARIIALQEGYEDADAAYYDAPDGSDEKSKWESVRDRCETAAEALTEEAARAVGDMIDSLIEGEHDYYTSPEFWRDWLSDGETRFTRGGERI